MMNGSNPDGNLLQPPRVHDRIALDPALGRRFTLIVDTEEEFDWDAPLARANTRVTALSGLAQGQAFFAAAGVKPIYVADYPVVASDAAAALLGQWSHDGAADIGAHLHSWVSPPYVERISCRNSYAGFLPVEVERAKLAALTARMTERFGRRPLAYRAGRYGVGPNSAALLEEAGYRLDSSVRSRFDYRDQDGPNFSGLPVFPYWAGPKRTLAELPLSTAFTGLLRGGGERLYRASRGMGPLTGLIARAGLLQRVPLTPEGVPAAAAIAAIDVLIEEDVPILNFSFHSPTLEPGHTPYVRDESDRRAFYAWWDRILAHLARRGVAPASLDDLLTAFSPRERSCQAA